MTLSQSGKQLKLLTTVTQKDFSVKLNNFLCNLLLSKTRDFMDYFLERMFLFLVPNEI